MSNAPNTTTYFAKTNFRSNGTDGKTFGIRTPDRRQHMYVIGKTGTGKTVLLKNMAIQDIYNGHGLAIVDPHGEFVEEVMESVPEERAADVVYINPADQDYAIGFNVLEVPDQKYKHLVASGLMGIFTKIWANVWSARMEYILNNSILALLDTPGSTLLGVPRLLVDKEYRTRIVNNIQDPVVRSFWIHEYEGYNDRLRSDAIAPIQNKVGQFLSTPLIRNIVGQPKSTINIEQIMDEGKILLVNVSKGRIGEDNSALLGAMMITKLQLAAMERVKIAEEERRDFFLYVDEFQNFATKSFASILSEARKYRLNLVIAHQYTAQLITDMDTSVRDAVFGNCGTMIIFRVGASDAELLEVEFAPEFEAQDLVNLPNYNVYVRLMCNGVTSRPFSAGTLPPIRVRHSQEVVQRIIDISRKKYARPRVEVEGEIQEWSSQVDRGGSSSNRQSNTRSSGGGDSRGGGNETRPSRPPAQKRGKFPGRLDELGIEFEGKSHPRSSSPNRSGDARDGKKSNRTSSPPHKRFDDARRKQTIVSEGTPKSMLEDKKVKEVSLSELLSKSRSKGSKVATAHEKKEGSSEKNDVDLDALRRSLAESLEKIDKR